MTDDVTRALADAAARAEMGRRTRRSFATGGIAALAGLAAWAWLRARPEESNLPWPLRRALRFNQRLAEGYFSADRLAPTFPVSRAAQPRANGGIGLGDFDPAGWSLTVAHGHRSKQFSLAQIKSLPQTDMVTELKCIEGWSTIVRWVGAPLSELAKRLGIEHGNAPAFVSLATPDQAYYVGLDRASAFHPQTLLAWEMNGAPLALNHGAPLRLVIPVKYGIKHLKRIGTIRFTDDQPADYWAERGYDWYAGH